VRTSGQEWARHRPQHTDWHGHACAAIAAAATCTNTFPLTSAIPSAIDQPQSLAAYRQQSGCDALRRTGRRPGPWTTPAGPLRAVQHRHHHADVQGQQAQGRQRHDWPQLPEWGLTGDGGKGTGCSVNAQELLQKCVGSGICLV
jgi:hypothetical protein